MDRHDVSETVTAEHIARLHQEDLKIQEQFGCRGLTYWFDEKRKTAFCLIEAPDEEAIRKMHNHAHGQVPHRVIEVDPGIVDSFLGRIEDPAKTQDTELNIINDPGFRIIMVAEVSRSSLTKNDHTRFVSFLHDFNKAALRVLQGYGGKPVKEGGYLFLVSFKSSSGAVRAAFDIRAAFKDFTKELNRDGVFLKIGLSAGSPVTDKKLLFQDAVKLAERICKIVKGDIIVSGEVKELYGHESPDPLEGAGIVSLSHADEEFLTLLMDYTESVWSDTNFKVDDFSKPLGYSKSGLYRKLVSLTGRSPNAFIRDYRLQEALALLNKNNGNISAIAFETGFTSPSYFSKCFQKKYGHQPSDYLSERVC